MLSTLQRFIYDQNGQSMAEYGLLTALIAVATIVAVRTVGSNIAGKFRELATNIRGAK